MIVRPERSFLLGRVKHLRFDPLCDRVIAITDAKIHTAVSAWRIRVLEIQNEILVPAF